MNAFLRRSNIASWSTWLKLAFGLTTVGLLTIIATIWNIQRIANAKNEEDLRQYLLDEGVERETLITGNILDALFAFTTFSTDQIHGRLLASALAGDNTELSTLSSTFDSSLISSSYFSRVLLLDANDTVITTNSGLSAIYENGTQITNTDVLFQTLQSAQVSDNPLYTDIRIIGSIPYVFVVYRFDQENETVGFLVAELNVNDQIVSILIDDVQYQNTYSYIGTLDGSVVAPIGFEERASRAVSQHNLVRLGLQGESGIVKYKVDGETRLGYYRGFLNRFVIITEVSLLSPINASTLIIDALPLLGFVIVIIVLLTYWGNHLIGVPISNIEKYIHNMQNNDFTTPVRETRRLDEIGLLAQSFATTREYIRQLLDDLGNRITAGVRDLEATGEVSRFASTQRDLQALMDNVVNLIVDKFPNIYHAQIFLNDSDNVYAVLRASTGDPGRKLLERGHRLGVGSLSVIGQVTDEGRVVAARDIASSDVHRKNEFLPDTRAELAIPLKVGEVIIGALDVQSKESNTFDEDQINILQTMADQIAIAIENARLYEESVQRLEELTISNQQATARAWTTYMQARHRTALYSESGIRTQNDFTSLREQAIAEEHPVIGEVTPTNTIPFAVPIILRGQTLGAVQWELPQRDFHEEKVILAQELVNRLALSLDNARLFQESRRAVNRERVVNEITARLTAQTNIEEILQTAVREVGQALRVPHVSINLESNDSNGSNGTGQIIEDDL